MRLALILACCCVCALAVLVGRCMDEGDREMPAPPPLPAPPDDGLNVFDQPAEVWSQADYDDEFARIAYATEAEWGWLS